MGGCLEVHLPAIAMVSLQFVSATTALLNRAAFLKGMSPMVFIVYRQAIAASVTFSISYFLRRKSSSPAMGMKSFLLIFVTAFIGVALSQFLYNEGLLLTSSSIATATSNLVPAVTFIFAAVIGLEQVNVTRLSSLAKISGTIFCVGGAVSMAFLRGPKILNEQLTSQSNHILELRSFADDQTWLLGCMLLFASMCCWSLWIILQVPITACYPDYLSLSAWMSLLSMLQAVVIGLFVERDPYAWNISSPLELSSCFFSGIVGSGILFFVQSWCVSRKGPFFSAMFSPLSTVITTELASIFLKEELYIGSLLGAFAVISGLYVVLWGKAKETKENLDHFVIQSSLQNVQGQTDCETDQEQPLLTDYSNSKDEAV